MGAPCLARAQSISIGQAVAIALSTYVEEESSSEFRVFPEPGYYPTLQERSNAIGTVYLRLVLLLDIPWLYFDATEVRIELLEFGWDEALTTHTACEAIEQVDGQFDDASAQYLPADSAWCLTQAPQTVSTTKDISEEELPALQIINIGVGGRYLFLNEEGWILYHSLAGGLAIATFVDPSSPYFFGVQGSTGLGVAYSLGSLVSIELETRLTGMLTESPDELQSRINHSVQTGGHILSTLFEGYGFFDVGLALRFNLSDL
ncbi:MAG: hypothetical protein RBU37_17910 [Myxococcota bacterium]|nr:hypothetical protein [Myxococcota bacterium]